MAPLFLKGIKGGGNLSCASPGSLAVCTSIDRRSIVRPAIASRAVERGSPHLQDPRRRTKPLKVAAPKPASDPRKSRRSSSERRNGTGIVGNKDLISPANSSRYLLTDSAFFDIFPELEPDLEPSLVIPTVNTPRLSSSSSSSKHHHDLLVPVSSPRLLRECSRGLEEPSPSIRRSSSSSTARLTHHDRDQVVVLRVSLHCKGCEAKVRKHISKMEGVRSFNIDFAAKKVTVVGNVTPLGVLNSVSKVKNAQFWPPPSSLSSSPPRSSASF